MPSQLHRQLEPVSIRLLGQFSLRFGKDADEQDAAQLRKRSRRAVELLQLLSLQPKRCLPHEQVVEALWPHLGADAGSANLRKAAHHARHLLGGSDSVVLRSGLVFLLPSREVDCDVSSFEQAADAALAQGEASSCRAALALYGGHLLPDAPYESWTEGPRRRLRDKYLRLLRGAGLLERLVAEEPMDESACLALMHEEIAAGRRSSALRCYANLRDHLQQHLGVKPGTEAQTLYAECLSTRHEAPALVGRVLELASVLNALRNTGVAPQRGAWIRGPAGIGKTAFCRSLAHEVRGVGWQVRSVLASDWTRPYGLATDLVEPLLLEAGEDGRQQLDQHTLAILSAMTPAAGAAQSLALPASRHQFVGAVRQLLLATSKDRPVLLIVDDAQESDDSSAELLAYLAASGPRLFVVFASRPVLPPVLGRHLHRMLRAGTLEEVELQPLAAQESALLAARVAPSTLEADGLTDIVRRAEGVPFAIVELARSTARRDGSRLPRTVAAAIAGRVLDVGEGAVEGLRRMALAAEEFEVSVALALAGESSGEESASCLDRALDAGVLTVEDGRYRFHHALLRQALVDGIPPHRLAEVHAEIASRLEQGRAAPGLIGQHWIAAGDVQRALPASLAAARQAFRLGAYEDVLRHVDPLVAHLPRQADALALRAEALDALARPGTLAAYDAAAEVAEAEMGHELKAKRALAQVKMSDPPGALKYLQDVKPTTVAGRLAEALAYSGAAALGFGDPAEGSRRAAEVRRLALETGDEGTLVIASWAQAAAAHARGDLHSSVWADLRETSHLPQLALRVFDGHLCITQRFLYGSRPYGEVIAFADALAAEAQRLGAARGHAFAVTLRGEAKLLSGQLDGAEDDLLLGGRLHRNIGGSTGEALSLQRRAELAMYRGRFDIARGLLAEALEVARQSEVGFHLFDRIYGTSIALARSPDAALHALEEAEDAVRGPLETCPGCRITFAIPATIAAARARQADLGAQYLQQSEYLANVVMKLPAWYAALQEARGHTATAFGDREAARNNFALATKGYRSAGHPLDAARCANALHGRLC